MFNDIFKGTDFGNIKSKSDEEKDKIAESASKNNIWNTGIKPNIWTTNSSKSAWDLDKLDENEKELKPQSNKNSGPSIFDDIF